MVSTSENKSTQLVWYITGTSSGLGKRLVTVLLNRGDKVIASARCIAKLQDFPKSENLRLQQLDVTDGPETMRQKAEEAVSWFGRIDVLVNNAGTGQKGILEEAGSQELRRQFNVNVFGLLDVTTAFLPFMRKQRSGTVVLLGSRSSWSPEKPTTGMYAASKAAVRVLGETLTAELAPFSIRVLIVEPGAFRTENIFAQPMYEDNAIAEYDAMRERAKKMYDAADGHQPGDPVKAVEVLADVVRGEGRAAGRPWPVYLPLGLEAETAIRHKCKVVTDVLDDWGAVIRDTRLDKSQNGQI